MSAHTPGPWEIIGPAGTWIQTKHDPYGHGVMHVADVRGWGHLTGRSACRLDEKSAIAIQDANARIIAAAPSLYEAMNSAMQYLDQTIGPCDEGCECILHDMHAALTMVDGKARR